MNMDLLGNLETDNFVNPGREETFLLCESPQTGFN
jgi:hypothetical protein